MRVNLWNFDINTQTYHFFAKHIYCALSTFIMLDVSAHPSHRRAKPLKNASALYDTRFTRGYEISVERSKIDISCGMSHLQIF